MKTYRILSALAVVIAFGTAVATADPLANTNELVWIDGSKLPQEGRCFADTETPYVRINRFHRDRIHAVNKGVTINAMKSSGICFRFATDTDQMTLKWTLRDKALNSVGLSNIAKSGIDIYEQHEDGTWKFVNWRFITPRNYPDKPSDIYTISWKPGRACWIYLPNYNGISEFALGLPKGKSVKPLPPRASGIVKPVVFYGSSITHGADASRPGLAYVSIAGRLGDFPVANFGFDGSAHMETEVCDMLAAVDASCYVLDPLGNMWEGEVKSRYEAFVRRLHAARPDVPIVLASYCAPFAWVGRREQRAKEIYDRLVAESDGFRRTLTFIATAELVPDALNETTTDGCHPNDFGMMQIGRTLAERIAVILKKRKGN